MQHFESDYLEGAHPRLLERLAAANFEKLPGYGADHHCQSARERLRVACNAPTAQITFLVGGTQANSTVIDALLRSWQGVVAADTGHIATHEAGAVEAFGHKVLTLPAVDGKLMAAQVQAYLDAFWDDANHEHMVEPGLVYISHPTEYGTLYTLDELTALHRVCQARGIPLFCDGARLGYGLAARGTDVTLPALAAATDVFTIGGTKVGALFGEAVVFTDPALVSHFTTITKRHGGLLAKGWLLGLQFDALFEPAHDSDEPLYLAISRHAIDQAMRLREALLAKGYPLFIDSPTNQQFVVLDDAKLTDLAEHVTFGFWEKFDADRTVVRFATSWATRTEDVDALLALL